MKAAHEVDQPDGELTERSAGESVDRQLLLRGGSGMLIGEVEDMSTGREARGYGEAAALPERTNAFAPAG